MQSSQVTDLEQSGGGGEEDLENGGESEDERARRRRGHTKTSSVSERDRKIGHRRINEAGQVSYKKVETNALMGSIQLGIHDSVGGLAKYPERDLLMHDFMTVETSQFPNKGGHQTPGHPYSDFTFRTYAPVAFRYFRDLFGIPPDDFMISICNESLRELSNPGASGSIFYLTLDDEFILKTVSLKEAEFLQKLLPGYYMNLQQNPRTLLPKFFGMFCYQANQKNIRLIVMNNLLPSGVKMHLKFDLKGSTYKRKASKHEREKKSPTFKDLDFLELLPEGLMLEPETYTALISTMRRDCRVLESFKIMDYSLLLGIHNLDLAAKEKAAESEASSSISGLERPRHFQQRQKLVAHSTAMESIQANSDPVDIPCELQGGMPARNHKGERVLLFVGLIDILQSYRLIKKLEHTFKAMIHDGDTVSVHRPGFYAERFMNFMSTKIFKKIPSSLKHSPSKKNKSVKGKGGQSSGQSPGSGTSPTEKSSQLTSMEGTHSVLRPDVVPDTWSTHEVSLSDVRLETRSQGLDRGGSLSHSTLDTPSKLSMRGTPTPTWTEGTPSYTESSYSGDQAFPGTSVRRSVSDSRESVPGGCSLPEDQPAKDPYHETEM